MKPEEINVAIAEVCGIKIVGTEDGIAYMDRPYDEKRGGLQPSNKRIPNYYEDLNAIHEAEKILDKRKGGLLAEELADVLELDGIGIWNYSDAFKVVHATAPQRCEAFLRTISKWVETKGEGE